MSEEQVVRKILEETDGLSDESYPTVVSDVWLLFIGIAWVLLCFFLFICGKKCIEKSVKKEEDQRLQFQR